MLANLGHGKWNPAWNICARSSAQSPFDFVGIYWFGNYFVLLFAPCGFGPVRFVIAASAASFFSLRVAQTRA
jgi:hypothetical protein